MEESKRLTPLVDCPVEKTIQLISNKWKVLIIRELLFEKRRFNELQRLIPGISPKVLIQNLKEMIEHELVAREVFPVSSPHVEYRLTDLGETLRPILDSMAAWGEQHL